MDVNELVKAKNVDLVLAQYNREAKIANREGFLSPDSKEAKMLKSKYENIMARFDTDKNTIKSGGKYYYNVPLYNEKVEGIKGIRPALNINRRI